MKKHIFAFIIIFGVLGSLCGIVNAQELSKEQIRTVKERYDYDNWGADSGSIIPGVAISRQALQQLSRSRLKNVWKKDTVSVGNLEGSAFSIVRKHWRSDDKNSLLDITMVVCTTFEAAKKYLILRYAASQVGANLVKPSGSSFGVDLGSVCFASPDKNDGHLSSIDFIRDNVVIMMRAEGEYKQELESIGRQLDRNLAKESSAVHYSQLKSIPTITRFSSRTRQIKQGNLLPLRLEVNCPDQKQLRYVWKMTGGGIEKDRRGNFYYYAGEEGKHTVTVTVLNDMGLQYTKSLEFIVVR